MPGILCDVSNVVMREEKKAMFTYWPAPVCPPHNTPAGHKPAVFRACVCVPCGILGINNGFCRSDTRGSSRNNLNSTEISGVQLVFLG